MDNQSKPHSNNWSITFYDCYYY